MLGIIWAKPIRLIRVPVRLGFATIRVLIIVIRTSPGYDAPPKKETL
jgi:hypothetical protein